MGWYIICGISRRLCWGLAIVWRLVEKLDYPKGLAVAAVLYLVGLFGDSYYGIVGRLPVVKKFYDLLFQLFDYTRNGIFFAPSS